MEQKHLVGTLVSIEPKIMDLQNLGAIGTVIGYDESLENCPYKVEFTPEHFNWFGEDELLGMYEWKTVSRHMVNESKEYRIVSDTSGAYKNLVVKVVRADTGAGSTECDVVLNTYCPLWNLGDTLYFDDGHNLQLIEMNTDYLSVTRNEVEEEKPSPSEISDEDQGAIMEAVTDPEPNAVMVEARKQASGMFVKLDDGKAELKYILDTPLASAEKCRVRKFGDEKYDRFNWYKCDDPERYLSAALRHLHAIAEDPNAIDEESGLPHRAHALCSLEFYNELVARKQKGIN